uniref:unspecific monooxygenase n=1 Tax=Melopsittacus undulatus TaxID=13146 RepID=A0A8V5HA18_MELUD
MDLMPNFSLVTWLLLILFLSLLVLYGLWPFQTFKKQDYQESWSLIGKCFEKYGKIWGSFDGRQPVLAGLDPILIKNILVKECYTNFGLNGILGSAISMAEDEKWKRIRTVLSPALTSEKLVKNIEKKVANNEIMTLKDIFEAYSMDVVVSTSFSVNIDSMSNPSDPFVTNMKKFLRFMLFPFIAPVLEKMNVTLLPSRVMDFFKGIFLKMKKEWENCSRTIDFLQLMVDSQSSHDTLSDEEILAQARVFVFAGYETTSSTLSYLSYNLATHPDVQQQLRDEIDSHVPNHPDSSPRAAPTYNAITQIEYLDMVVNESLWLFPPWAYVLHRDLAYWLEQEEFRPERTESIDPYTFLPFGAGPRNCIGMRFALLIVKVAVVVLLQHFSFRTFKDTPVRIWDGVFHYLPFSPTEMVLYNSFCIHLRTNRELSLMHIKSLSSLREFRGC